MASPLLDLTHCCRPSLRRLSAQSRPFTTTPIRRKHGPVPAFTPTPSEDLDALLKIFRKNIFLPSHLIQLQRTLLYRKKHHALLTSDEPATVRLGDEVHQLLPLDHQRDEPATRPAFAKIIELMAHSDDWKNLPGFLEGLKTARRSIKSWQYEKMTRRACEKGRIGVIHDCLRRVESTGLGLWDLRVAREVVWGAIMKASLSGWSEEGVERGVKYADNVWDLMADPRHVARMTPETDPKKRPEVLGVMILMHAMKALRIGEGRDEGDVVKKYTRSMLNHWKSEEVDFADGDWNDANYKFLMWAPVWRGITMAQKVLDPTSPLAKELEARLSRDLEPLMQQGQALLSGTRRGLKLYNELSELSV